MNKLYSCLVIVLMSGFVHLMSQTPTYNISPDLKFNIYLDSYYLSSFGKLDDSLNIASFAGNSKFTDEFRLNTASLMIKYITPNIRASLDLEFGDNAHLMATIDNEFVKYLGYAKVGYRIVDDLWIDVGYISDPIGCESSKPGFNMISSVTFGGYFQPENFLGLIMDYTISEQFDMKLFLGNPYTVRFGKNKNINGGMQLSYSPVKDLKITYSNIFGDKAELYSNHHEWRLYNNLVGTYQITDDLYFIGQFDFSQQKGVFGDDERQEYMTSGFAGAKYQIVKNFSAAARYEFFRDEYGMATGYLIDGRLWSTAEHKWDGYGMNMSGFSVSLEYNPYGAAYIRGEYRYNQASDGQLVFNRNTDSKRQYLLFTTGIMF